MKYTIHELSARTILGYAREKNEEYSFSLTAAETKRCVSRTGKQDDNALFYQIMCVLHGDDFTVPKNQLVVSNFAEIIFYMDFGGIFDHRTDRKKYLTRQKKAEAMFCPEGFFQRKPGISACLCFEEESTIYR